MRIAGGVALGVAVAAAGLIAAAVAGALGGSTGGYVCFGIVAVVFGIAGAALLAGSTTMPDNWPPRDDDSR